MIKTWIADVTPLYEAGIYEKYYCLVPDFRKEKADKIMIWEKKAQSIGVWVLLQKMKEYYELNEQTNFNLSHSGKYVLCSVDDSGTEWAEVGCDVEMVGRYHANVAKRYFAEEEISWIHEKQGVERAERFYRIWVLRESFLKATRKGMQLDMKTFAFHMKDTKEKWELSRQPKNFAKKYYFREYRVGNGEARVAVCADRCEFSKTMKVFCF